MLPSKRSLEKRGSSGERHVSVDSRLYSSMQYRLFERSAAWHFGYALHAVFDSHALSKQSLETNLGRQRRSYCVGCLPYGCAT
mmetsp:Transcript_24305/g.46676  ORF Transcript_24305/g.46676 Transcript_24305/m.46676 type:complete len:83 (-) Transcript_24305:142-390(-)